MILIGGLAVKFLVQFNNVGILRGSCKLVACAVKTEDQLGWLLHPRAVVWGVVLQSLLVLHMTVDLASHNAKDEQESKPS